MLYDACNLRGERGAELDPLNNKRILTIMKTNENNSQAKQAELAPITKARMEELQRTEATAIECDKEKKVSGKDYLVIFIRALIKLDLMPKENYQRAIQAAEGMKANNSALRQWLYETKQAEAKVGEIADRYLSGDF